MSLVVSTWNAGFRLNACAIVIVIVVVYNKQSQLRTALTYFIYLFAHIKLPDSSGHLMGHFISPTMHVFIQRFVCLLQLSHAFHKSPFLSHYVMLLFEGDRMQ